MADDTTSREQVFLKGSTSPLDVLYGPFHIHGHGKTCEPKFLLVRNPETRRIVAVPRSLVETLAA